MQQLAKLLPLLALASAAPTTFSPRADDGKSQVKVGDVLPTAIKADVQAMLDYFNIPGAVVAVVSPDEAVNGVEVFGVKDAEGNKMTADVSLLLRRMTRRPIADGVDILLCRFQF